MHAANVPGTSVIAFNRPGGIRPGDKPKSLARGFVKDWPSNVSANRKDNQRIFRA